jgi:spermidine synthase
MDRKRGCARLAALALVLLCLSVASSAQILPQMRLIHSEKSLYRQVLVYEDEVNRCLCFTHLCSVGRQSCIDLKSPEHLVFEYTQMMLGALYLNPDPHRVLIIGLGGGTLPQVLVKLLPQVQIDAVEIDPAVVQVAQRYFGFQADSHVHVIEQDGRVYVRAMQREGRRYDLIMLDAYDNEYIPEHMLTREFLGEVRSLLPPGGILAANTFSQSQLYSSESVTYRSVFGDFYNLKSGNRVILVANGTLPSLETVTRNSQRFSGAFEKFGFSAQSLLERFSTRADWDTQARILTDQYSPANLLNGTSH